MHFVPVVPLIAAFYAALLGLLGAALTVRVIVQRARLHVNAGDGGVPAMAQAIRAHANFAEHVPLALLLIAFAELLGTPALPLHVLGVSLIVASLAKLGCSVPSVSAARWAPRVRDRRGRA